MLTNKHGNTQRHNPKRFSGCNRILNAEPAEIWRNAGRFGLTSSGRGSSTVGYVEPWVAPRKHTSCIDKVNLKFASLERSEGHEEPIIAESDIRSW